MPLLVCRFLTRFIASLLRSGLSAVLVAMALWVVTAFATAAEDIGLYGPRSPVNAPAASTVPVERIPALDPPEAPRSL